MRAPSLAHSRGSVPANLSPRAGQTVVEVITTDVNGLPTTTILFVSITTYFRFPNLFYYFQAPPSSRLLELQQPSWMRAPSLAHSRGSTQACLYPRAGETIVEVITTDVNGLPSTTILFVPTFPLDLF
jgi:hypothetical protein